MAALTADRITRTKGPLRRATYPVLGSTTIFAGSLVCLDATGFAIPATDTAGLSPVAGVATANQDNSAGADGDVEVVVEYHGAFLIDVAASITQPDVGQTLMVDDDQTGQDAAAATNDIVVGGILEYLNEAQDKAWVNIPGPV